MTPGEAKQILQALLKGIDPETGQEIPADSPLHSPFVLRALFLGVEALSAVDRPRAVAPASKPENAGKPWSADEDGVLLQGFDAGQSIRLLAERHGRSRGAITARLVRLGRLEERSAAPAED